MAKNKKPVRKNEFPLNEDMQEMGFKYEYKSDAEREAARKKAAKPSNSKPSK